MNMHVQTIEVAGQRLTLLPETEYLKLLVRAGSPTPELHMPPMPAKLPSGNYPAREYLRASIAREIIRTRRRLGLSQAELARRAGLAIAHLNRLERAKGNPTAATVAKIDAALKAAEKEALSGKKRGASTCGDLRRVRR
ncbi:MAG: helix-turn-helix domain-containing protein [Planctomycetes bacterium]|jgi:ribosome-binding protein aMBF1 (putative translation factor)|nr:helix-turn-helix domain-containing protein [Planctomycetota bacterium]